VPNLNREYWFATALILILEGAPGQPCISVYLGQAVNSCSTDLRDRNAAIAVFQAMASEDQ
jgi:hypothetical protein